MLAYLLIRFFTFPLAYLPYSWLHALGRLLGPIAYQMFPKWRKRALSNIALVFPTQDPRPLARACFQHLLITCLEYPKLAREKEISRIAICENPETALELMKNGKGVIFFCGHQANWELLFLEGTSRMPGVAIGRPIKNKYLYSWIKGMRERMGGKVFSPKEAVKEGLRALKQGKFLGIVGDQGMPDSGFSCPFLGRLAWTSPLPALLSIRTGAPIIVADIRRENGKYFIQYSDPLYPSPNQEIDSLMRTVLGVFEKRLLGHPEQWLWIHNRWKQQVPNQLKKPYRQDAFAIFLPNNRFLVEQVSAFRELYPREFIVCFVPDHLSAQCTLSDAEIVSYKMPCDLLQQDFRFKLLFNFTEYSQIDQHYQKLSVSFIVRLEDLLPAPTLREQLQKTLRYAG